MPKRLRPITKSSHPFAWMGGKVENVANHCLYEIATGRWPAGFRLPSVREAERQWKVNRLTVLRAYERLAAMGLVSRVNRSGFYVADNDRLDRVTRHRFELDRLYEGVLGYLRRETDLSAIGVFRYLGRLAESRAHEHPEAAFVECTAIQAQGHVAEIEGRLRVPVLALTLDQIGGRRSGLPRNLRTLLTSPWHLTDIAPLAQEHGLRTMGVPIEIAPDVSRLLARGFRDATILDTSESEAFHLRRDIQELGVQVPLLAEVVPDIEKALSARYGRKATGRKHAVLLSPRHWGAVAARWRNSASVLPVRFRFCETAWADVADALGLPLG